MFWNRKKNTQASGHANDEAVQRPRVAQTTTISMGNAPGVWVKTTGNTDVNPVVIVATSERVALVESAATFMYDLKNSNDSEIVSALAWSPRPISLIAAGATAPCVSFTRKTWNPAPSTTTLSQQGRAAT